MNSSYHYSIREIRMDLGQTAFDHFGESEEMMKKANKYEYQSSGNGDANGKMLDKLGRFSGKSSMEIRPEEWKKK